MTKRILSKKRSNYHFNSANNKFNTGIKNLSEHYKTPAQKLILHMMEVEHYTLDDIAKIIGVTKTAVGKNWLKPITEETNNE